MTPWSVWSWDDQHKTWLEVAEGSRRDMTKALERKRSAATRLMPSARFTMTRQDQPPQDSPDDQEA
jgi:hypothetical protein